MRTVHLAVGILSAICLVAFSEISYQGAAFAGPELQPQALQTTGPLPRPLKRKQAAEQRPAVPREAVDKAEAEPLLPYTPDWWAREKAIDDKLKKSITICRDC
jgi:hypothetical protein